MATLYRRYRPQKFAEVEGQEHVTETLQQAAHKGRLAHAYLFYGPRGTGKTTMARLLAKRVNCLHPGKHESCGKCVSCRAMAGGKHTDVIEIDAASNRGIDDVRALTEHINLSPAMGKMRVYIIDEVHMLTRDAAAALLKTLEEPVEHAMFILATTELHKVLPTILSRCQVFRFKRAAREEMMKRLKYILKQEKRVASDETLEFIIERTDGCYRDAESSLGQLLTLSGKQVGQKNLQEFMGLPPEKMLHGFLDGMGRRESTPALAAVDEAFQGGYDPEQFLKEGVRLARDEALRLAAGEKGKLEGISEERWPEVIRALLQALQDLAYVPQPMIAVQLAVLSVCTTKGEEKPVVREDKVKAAWPELINEVKKSNPVAATFLRAVRPTVNGGGEVLMQVQYALHQTFFDKPDSRKLIAKVLGRLLGQEVRVTCRLDEEGVGKRTSLADKRKEHENNFQQTVKEVFG